MSTTTSISHFTHPEHRLVMKTGGRSGCFTCRRSRPQDFTCRMCEAEDSGARYRCDACKFDLHEHCSLYPETLPPFFGHTPHPLKLAPSLAGSNRPTICDFCNRPVLGYSYRCDDCAFYLHPLCSLLKQTVRSDQHGQHPLTLHPAAPAACAACQKDCILWRYRCGVCMINLHTYCLDVAPAVGPENAHANHPTAVPAHATAPAEGPENAHANHPTAAPARAAAPAGDATAVQKEGELDRPLKKLAETTSNVAGKIIEVAGDIIIGMISN